MKHHTTQLKVLLSTLIGLGAASGCLAPADPSTDNSDSDLNGKSGSIDLSEIGSGALLVGHGVAGTISYLNDSTGELVGVGALPEGERADSLAYLRFGGWVLVGNAETGEVARRGLDFSRAGDTFQLPSGAEHLYASILGRNVKGFDVGSSTISSRSHHDLTTDIDFRTELPGGAGVSKIVEASGRTFYLTEGGVFSGNGYGEHGPDNMPKLADAGASTIMTATGTRVFLGDTETGAIAFNGRADLAIFVSNLVDIVATKTLSYAPKQYVYAIRAAGPSSIQVQGLEMASLGKLTPRELSAAVEIEGIYVTSVLRGRDDRKLYVLHTSEDKSLVTIFSLSSRRKPTFEAQIELPPGATSLLNVTLGSDAPSGPGPSDG